ncbi:hypothetical protein AB6N16_23025 [Pseudomonas marginalis]
MRATAAGAKSYIVRWGRGRKKALGRVGMLTLDQARQEATQASGSVSRKVSKMRCE